MPSSMERNANSVSSAVTVLIEASTALSTGRPATATTRSTSAGRAAATAACPARSPIASPAGRPGSVRLPMPMLPGGRPADPALPTDAAAWDLRRSSRTEGFSRLCLVGAAPVSAAASLPSPSVARKRRFVGATASASAAFVCAGTSATVPAPTPRSERFARARFFAAACVSASLVSSAEALRRRERPAIGWFVPPSAPGGGGAAVSVASGSAFVGAAS